MLLGLSLGKFIVEPFVPLLRKWYHYGTICQKVGALCDVLATANLKNEERDNFMSPEVLIYGLLSCWP